MESLQLYPDGNGFALKQKLAKILSIKMAQITLGNGSNDVLDLIARVFLNAEREAIFSEYAFAVYPIVTQAVGAQAKIAKAYPPEHNMPYGHDLDAMARLITDKTAVIFIANPNNPTGTWLGNEALASFIATVPTHIIVVVDEAYFEYVDATSVDYPNSLEWIDRYPNLIVTRTFSKIYGLAALRIGYSVSNPQITDLLSRVRQPFNVNSLALIAANAALDDQHHIEQSRLANQAGLQQLQQALTERQLTTIPSIGNFITFDTGQDAAKIYQALLREAIIVRPVANYHLPQHLRVTIGTKRQNQRFLTALDKVLTL